MKKRILIASAVMIIAAVVAWNVNYNSQVKGMSNVSLANVEALANAELTGACHGENYACQFDCPNCGDLLGAGGEIKGTPSNLSGTCPNCGFPF